MTKQTPPDDQLEIEMLLMANHAEAVNGLLYISGGAWTEHYRAIVAGGPPPVSYVAIALSIRVPWNEANVQHRLVVRIENEDATSEVAKIEAGFIVGRPPNIPSGAVQHTPLAIPLMVVFPKSGGYRCIGSIDGAPDGKTWSFRVHDRPVSPPATVTP